MIVASTSAPRLTMSPRASRWRFPLGQKFLRQAEPVDAPMRRRKRQIEEWNTAEAAKRQTVAHRRLRARIGKAAPRLESWRKTILNMASGG
jgi:hypothetical protein